MMQKRLGPDLSSVPSSVAGVRPRSYPRQRQPRRPFWNCRPVWRALTAGLAAHRSQLF